ncbi:MAG: DUF1207 domain-containing protein, partial [Nitrosomonas sp.]|nr:DUF1207 domain-containing protein [Nitrosomonas sp.]
MLYLRFIALFGVMLFYAPVANSTPPSDAYIAGYATSMLKHKLMLDIPSLIVQNGVIILPKGSLDIPDRSNVVRMLSEIPGVNEVKIAETTAELPTATAPSQPIKQDSDQTVAITNTDPTLLPTGLLPSGHLFKPLLADPRWAHFSASYRHYVNDNFEGRNIGAVSFGETIPFYRGNFGSSLAP